MVFGSTPRATRGRGAALALALVLTLGPALAACGDDSGGDDSAPPTPSPKPPTSGEPTSAEPSSARPSGSGPADRAAAEKEIKTNWKKFFDPKVSMKEKEAVLEDGAKMRPVLKSFSGDKRGGQVEATVTKVAFTSATAADVTYGLALKGATVLPDAKGTSVERDGIWKVSVNTLCALVQLSGNASPGPGC
ncbi:hypothetical protein [Streptomyces endophyticus]|uniref:Low molecular weight antigen MTB12-like C-terminal domain-containing protein n=1 Tax=Streptomyces endophyticus TaxID=714166 RepID=A0ABU6FGV8_9ACTN|nr:hypothetical protein [Streptomyces endophyticus]MEB8343284.1 hypothetical protein [Streptomyces endophyticus]